MDNHGPRSSSADLRLVVTDRGRVSHLGCRAILFDMDGTLVDSTGCVEETWRAWGTRHGLDLAQLIEIGHGRQNPEVIRIVAPHLETPEELAALERAEEDCREGLRAIPGAAALLATLPASRWAVVTSAWRKLAEIRLACAGLPLPGTLITADDVSASKPDPAGYLMAARVLGLAPADCVVVEDAPAGVAAGLAAGMRVIGITTTSPRERLGLDLCVPDLRAIVLQT